MVLGKQPVPQHHKDKRKKTFHTFNNEHCELRVADLRLLEVQIEEGLPGAQTCLSC